ncbi:HAD-IC family P-type ATPase, partial [Paenibacillus odorifer]
MSTVKRKKLLTGPILLSAVKDSFIKLNPVTLIKNPVMFVVEIGTIIVLLMVLAPGYFNAEKSVGFNITVLFILLFTVLFANFAEALAEGRGKAQADSLKKTKQDITANKLVGGSVKTVSSSELRKGDIVIVSQGELIPGDGEVIEGLASVDESAITGESAPVIKEAGGDFGSVTGGTRVVSDEIKVKITSDPGES